MSKVFLIVLLSLWSLTLFAQKKVRLDEFIKRMGYVKLADTSCWPQRVRPEFVVVKDYLRSNNLILNDYYVSQNQIFITNSQFKITVKHIKSLKILMKLEYKNKHSQQQTNILGNVSGKDGQFVIDIKTQNVKFLPEE